MSTCLSRKTVTQVSLRCGVGILLLAAVGRAGAQETSARDLARELQVLHALHRDPQLKPLNIGVKVHDRVAVLWGPVPTRALAERAVLVVKKLPEIGVVDNQLMVQFREETVYPPLPLVPKPTPRKSDPPPPPESLLPPMLDLVWQPVNPERPATPPKPSVALLPSLTSQPSVTGTVSRPREKLEEPPDAAAISGAVQSLIQSDQRYRRVRYEVKQGQVFLGGVVGRWSDLRELSVAVTHIPGVDSVVLREVRAEPRP
jgi:osmotically-inducible protein OsmY